MGKEQDTNFYDEYYAKHARWRRLRYAPWFPLWEFAARWIKDNSLERVVDLGCGIGPIARLLDGAVRYTGYDFSAVAIKRACNELRGPCEANFVVRDLNQFDGSEFDGADGVVACEVFEHLDDDLALVAKLPMGIPLLFTVPNFMMATHVRRFITELEVVRRYQGLVELAVVRRLGKRHFAAWGKRRAL